MISKKLDSEDKIKDFGAAKLLSLEKNQSKVFDQLNEQGVNGLINIFDKFLSKELTILMIQAIYKNGKNRIEGLINKGILEKNDQECFINVEGKKISLIDQRGLFTNYGNLLCFLLEIKESKGVDRLRIVTDVHNERFYENFRKIFVLLTNNNVRLE